jgi:hypothetical protein
MKTEYMNLAILNVDVIKWMLNIYILSLSRSLSFSLTGEYPITSMWPNHAWTLYTSFDRPMM